MKQLKATIKLTRPTNCLFAGLGAIIGAIVALKGIPPLQIGFAFGAAALITGGGNAINDYSDRKIDTINKPNRPIPQGNIKPLQAFEITGLLFGIGIILAALTGKISCTLLAIFNSGMLTYYANSLKRKGLPGNLTIGYLVGSTFLFGALAIGKLEVAGILAAMAGFSTVGRELVKDIEDMVGDSKVDSKSFPLKYGKGKAAFLAIIFTGIAVGLTPLPFILGIFGKYYIITVLISVTVFVGGMSIIGKSQTKDSAGKASFLYKIAMGLGLIAFLIGGLI